MKHQSACSSFSMGTAARWSAVGLQEWVLVTLVGIGGFNDKEKATVRKVF